MSKIKDACSGSMKPLQTEELTYFDYCLGQKKTCNIDAKWLQLNHSNHFSSTEHGGWFYTHAVWSRLCKNWKLCKTIALQLFTTQKVVVTLYATATKGNRLMLHFWKLKDVQDVVSYIQAVYHTTYEILRSGIISRKWHVNHIQELDSKLLSLFGVINL